MEFCITLKFVVTLGKLTTKGRKMRKFLGYFAGAIVGLSLSVSAAKADCGEVSVGAMGWASGESIAAVAKFVLEVGYGCKVKIVGFIHAC